MMDGQFMRACQSAYQVNEVAKVNQLFTLGQQDMRDSFPFRVGCKNLIIFIGSKWLVRQKPATGRDGISTHLVLCYEEKLYSRVSGLSEKPQSLGCDRHKHDRLNGLNLSRPCSWERRRLHSWFFSVNVTRTCKLPCDSHAEYALRYVPIIYSYMYVIMWVTE